MYRCDKTLGILHRIIFAFFLALTAYSPGYAQALYTTGQTLYVPVYSHVYIGDRAKPFNLSATLSVRNTDRANQITLISADYYDSEGNLLKRMLPKPVKLRPLASTSFFIKERDTRGGFGASFIVRWHAEREVSAPLVESLMIGTYSGQGISFVGASREIR